MTRLLDDHYRAYRGADCLSGVVGVGLIVVLLVLLVWAGGGV